MKITKLSMITSAVIAATLSASAVAGHHEEKISMGFNAMDKDGNGYIVGSESSGVIDSKLLAKMDTDGDSMISRVEFNKFVESPGVHVSHRGIFAPIFAASQKPAELVC